MSSKLRVLDLFCGAGGAAMGYYNAFTESGFDVDIIGVDNVPQKHYPFTQQVGDAMTWPLEGYDFIHASPPCHDHSVATAKARHEGMVYGTGWMLEATYQRLSQLNIPWIIENVAGAKMHNPIVLCGSMFDLRVIRHRKFDSNVPLTVPTEHVHKGTVKGGYYITVVGSSYMSSHQPYHTRQERYDAMGINWMTNAEVVQAVPPAYTHFLGKQIAQFLKNMVQ